MVGSAGIKYLEENPSVAYGTSANGNKN
jgi:hypothetical protein